MLYFFPSESSKCRRKKERLNLQKEINRAEMVIKEGYRRREMSLPSCYVEWRCMYEYLQCPIENWKLPQSSKEKVELEKLQTEFFNEPCNYKPLMFYDPVAKEKVQRIVGFREILKKREYVEFLKKIECMDDDSDDNIECSVNEKLRESTTIEIDMLQESINLVKDDPKTYRSLRIARGGGDKKKKDKKDKKGKDKDKKKKKSGSGNGSKEGIISKIIHYFVGDDKDKKKDKKREEKARKEDKRKAAEKSKETKIKSAKWVLPNLWHQDIMEQKKLAKEHKQNLESIFKYHNLFRVPASKERDSEWLILSNTDPEEEKKTLSNFGKVPASWMEPGISFESQYLTRSLRIYLWALKLSGRSFVTVKADYSKKHMDFTHRKRDVLLFFLTTIVFWVAFCLMIAAFVDIQWENSETNTRSGTPEQKLISTLEASYQRIDELELYKYQIPLLVIIINLILVAVWSILIILGDGILIAHYFNCWCAALTEMETSGCLKIQKKIIVYHVVFTLYAIALSVLFYLNYPAHIRYSTGLVASMIARPISSTSRVAPDHELLPYQIAGLVFQIYLMYSAMMIKLLMQIFAIVLKNASEMWNFKFALTFQQLKNRGQLYRMGLKHSLAKLFTHHRLLTVLLRNFGEVFAIPIFIYMVSEMAVMTLTMVRMFFYKAGKKEEYDGSDSVHIFSAGNNPEPTIKIPVSGRYRNGELLYQPYYHTPAEDYLIFLLMLAQLVVQYLTVSECLAGAGDAFFAGYEFVRRSGAMLCHNSHQRRLIQSLEWSFSSTNPSVLSVNSYFAINRETILGSFAAVTAFFSLIIQLQVVTEKTTIKFLSQGDCDAVFVHYILKRGACVPDANFYDQSLSFTG